MIKLQKGELWRPEDLNEGFEKVSVRVATGNAWVTFKCSDKDLIFGPGQMLELNQRDSIVEALGDELNLEVEFFKRAKGFFAKR